MLKDLIAHLQKSLQEFHRHHAPTILSHAGWALVTTSLTFWFCLGISSSQENYAAMSTLFNFGFLRGKKKNANSNSSCSSHEKGRKRKGRDKESAKKKSRAGKPEGVILKLDLIINTALVSSCRYVNELIAKNNPKWLKMKSCMPGYNILFFPSFKISLPKLNHLYDFSYNYIFI